MATYRDIAETEERIEQLHMELDAADNCAQDIVHLHAELAREEQLLAEQCAACGVKFRTRAEVIAWWDALPTLAQEGASL